MDNALLTSYRQTLEDPRRGARHANRRLSIIQHITREQHGDDEAKRLLAYAMDNDPDERVRGAAAKAIAGRITRRVSGYSPPRVGF